MKLNNGSKKIGVCMLFAASCFIAAFVLVEFHEVYAAVAIAGILLMLSAYLLLTVVLAKKIGEWSKAEEEEPPSNGEAEFREQIGACLESIDRTQRAMFAMVKRNLELREEHSLALEKAIEKLAAEQTAGVKAIVKYNKENARQLAVNERQSMSEIKKDINDSISENVESLKKALCESIEALSDKMAVLPQGAPFIAAGLAEAEQVKAEPAEEITTTEPLIEETVPEEVIIPESIMEEQIPEPEPVKEEPAFDPNAKLSPEDIAKLFAAAAEPAAEEPLIPEPEPVKEESAFDPNAKLSPEDIAKLFAAMGN